MEKFFNLIANPSSKNGVASLEKAKAVLDMKNIQYNDFLCKSPEEAREIAARVSQEGGNLVAIGGDGTFNNVINGIKDFAKTKLGFIIGGTGNDFAETFKINKDPAQAMCDILENNVGTIDLLDVNGRKCLNVTSTGLDIEVLRTYNKMKLFKGKIKYLLSLLITLMRFGSYHTVFKIDGQEYERNALIIAGGNGQCYGGGMKVTPHADLTDGKISVTVVNKVPKIKYPIVLPKFIKGKHEKLKKYIEQFVCEEFEVSLPDEAVPTLEVDGEVLENAIFKCKILPNLLNVFMPTIKA
ncbi:MAG: YegS/Rv2252/BmrU family lipid kinase [Clostridia bacterium]|nr:YegS/Rv2252/BmrU family lipid kinase [Clostridia bacterium]